MRKRQLAAEVSLAETTGSPKPGEPLFLTVGLLRRPHGVNGEILMDILTDFPERLGRNKLVYVGEEHKPFRIEHIRPQDQALLVTFSGIEDANQAGLLRNQQVYVQADSLPDLPEGTYYHHQLIGLAVVDPDGQSLGILTDILETGANDVYVVTSAVGVETLLPVIEAVILKVDLERREMYVNPPIWE